MKFSRRDFLKDSSAAGLVSLMKPATLSASLKEAPSLPSQSHTPDGLPRMAVQDFTGHFEPAYLSNGLIGIRPGPNPLAKADTYVSGFVGNNIQNGVESRSLAPYPLGTGIRVEGIDLLKHPELLHIQRQSLDMGSGELTTHMSFAPGNGVTLDIQVLQFASRSIPSVLCQEIQVTPSADTEIEFVPSIDGADVPGRISRDKPFARKTIDLVSGFESGGSLSRLGVALLFFTPDGPIQKQDPVPNATGVSRTCSIRASRGRPVRFQTIAAMVSQTYQPQPELQAIRLANWAGVFAFEELRDKNRRQWSDLWLSRVRVSGNTDAQRALDAAFFYLHSSLHPSLQTGMGSYGLSGAHYNGHSFWDTETWSLLPITLTSPATARSLLEYRVRGLGHAKGLADLYGYRGIQFPWEASPISGFDATPTDAREGWLEHHVTPDVALGFWEYQLATNDQSFLREGTWPVLRGVAEWIESRGTFTNRGFEIRSNVMNPDEDWISPSNDAYMNMISKMAVAAAIRCAAMVGASTPASWAKIRDHIVLPIDKAKGVVLPCDPPVSPLNKKYPIGMMDFLTVHDAPLSLQLLRNTVNYERGLPASSRIVIGFKLASMAATNAFLGYRQRATELFDRVCKDFWIEPFGMNRERPWPSSHGCFITSLGAMLQTAMLGFTGIRVREGDWRKYPASLPEGWSRIEIDRVWVKGEPKRLIATDGVPAKLLDE